MPFLRTSERLLLAVRTTYVFKPTSLSKLISRWETALSNHTPIGKYDGLLGKAFVNRL